MNRLKKKIMEKEIEQLVEINELVDLSLELVEGRFFDVEHNSLYILVVVPTKG
jgi:hypothetical protein